MQDLFKTYGNIFGECVDFTKELSFIKGLPGLVFCSLLTGLVITRDSRNCLKLTD